MLGMALRTVRVDDHESPGWFDPVALGARSGLLWRSPTVSLAGIGVYERLPMERPVGGRGVQAALAALDVDDGQPGPGPIAFGALPFDRYAPSELIVPTVLVGVDGSRQWMTFDTSLSRREAIELVELTLGSELSPPSPRICLTPTLAADVWRDEIIGKAIVRLGERGLRKVVLARELVLTSDRPFAVDRVVLNLAEQFPKTNLFSIDGFVGASPELLVARSGRVVRARPLAGTAARGADEKADAAQIAELISSTKDQTEHRITIDWFLSELLPFCSYVDAEPEPSVLTMSNVHHLATLVEGMLSEPAASVLELLAAVHPTPAVGGAPQAEALELIAELEGFDRGRYAGPTGWVDVDGNGEFAVSVRSVQILGDEARVWAGVGVVGASDPAAELRETQAKFRAILQAILS